MRKIDLNNKTILFIGAVGGMSYSVQHAKELGAQTIVTDYYTNSQAKEFGDYNIDISTTDIDKLDELIYQYKPDGIFTGFSDVNLRSLSLLARKHNMYSYATEKQVEILQDKNKFKSLCIENGILVPNRYTEEDIENINFPVIVKPADAYAAKGITVCNSINQLPYAIDKARNMSRNNEVIIEEYIKGNEVMIHYIMINGHVKFTSVLNRVIYEDFSGRGKDIAPIVISNRSSYVDDALKYEKNIENLLKSINVKNSVGFFQTIANDNGIYFFETAFRFGGNLSELFNYYENDTDIVGEFLSFSISGAIDEKRLQRISPKFVDYCVNITLFMSQGKVCKIEGQEKLNDIDIFKDVQRYVSPGDVIDECNEGSYKAMAFRIVAIAASQHDVIERLRFLRNYVHVIGENGEDLIQWDKTIIALEDESKQ